MFYTLGWIVIIITLTMPVVSYYRNLKWEYVLDYHNSGHISTKIGCRRKIDNVNIKLAFVYVIAGLLIAFACVVFSVSCPDTSVWVQCKPWPWE